MTGYVRVDTGNNIADGNVINATDLDNEFDGVQAAFNSSTGHVHDGTSGNGAPITKIGPVQDVVVSISSMSPKTTNTVDLGTSSLKYKDLYLAGNASVAGTLGVTGVATFTAQPVLSSLTASQVVFTDASKGLVSNAITGTGNVVMSTSPTLVTPALGTPSALVGTNITGTATAFTASNVTTNANLTGGVTSVGNAATVVTNANLTGHITSVGNATSLGSFTSAQLAGALTDETGTGANVFATSPTLVTPALGTPSSGVVTNLTGTASININGTVGATTASTGAFTTLTTSSTVTHNGGTANGVAYLNGSKVLATGSALTFDGTNLGIGTSSPAYKLQVYNNINGTPFAWGNATRTGYLYQDVSGVGITNAAGTGFDEGVYLDTASSKVVLYTNSTERVTLDSSGNLGLGVTPSAWDTPYRALDVSCATIAGNSSGPTSWYGNNVCVKAGTGSTYKATGPASAYLQYQNQHQWFNAPSGTAGNAISFTQAMTLTSGGVLQVGTTQTVGTGNAAMFGVMTGNSSGIMRIGSNDQALPALALTNWSGSATNNGCYVAFDNSGRGGFAIGASAGSNNFDICRTWGTPDVRIDSSGNLLVSATSVPGAGSSTTGAAFAANGYISVQRAAATPCFFGRSNDGEVMALYSGTTQRGQVSISGATTTYGSFSDYRLKENVTPIFGGLAKVMTLKPSTFNFIEFPEQAINGFIAHEVAEVEAIAVVGEKDAVNEKGTPLYQSVDAAKLVPLLTAAIQEQQALITALTARITALESN